MAIQSISDAYSRHGSEGLTEAGRTRRSLAISGIASGTTLLVIGLVLGILAFTVFLKFKGPLPSVGSGVFGIDLCVPAAIGLILAGSITLREKLQKEKIDLYIAEPSIARKPPHQPNSEDFGGI